MGVKLRIDLKTVRCPKCKRKVTAGTNQHGNIGRGRVVWYARHKCNPKKPGP